MKGVKDLETRTNEFIEKLEAKGLFEYIEGYVNIKSDVVVRHKKCGHITVIKAYNVAYANIDLCKECGRQKRDFEDKKKEFEEANKNLALIDKVKNKFERYNYVGVCRECGYAYSMAYDRLKDFKCCGNDEKHTYIKVKEKKGIEIYNNIRKKEGYIEPEYLREYVFTMLEGDSLVECKGIYDIDRLVDMVVSYILERYEKERVAVCKCCGEVKSGTRGWGRGDKNYSSNICVSCAKTSKKCSKCGVSKRINSYPVIDGKVSDICMRCSK